MCLRLTLATAILFYVHNAHNLPAKVSIKVSFSVVYKKGTNVCDIKSV